MNSVYRKYWFSLCLCLLCGLNPMKARALTADPESPQGTVRLIDGDVFKGTFPLRADGQEGTPRNLLTWRCPTFADPVSIPWDLVESISLDRLERGMTPQEKGSQTGPDHRYVIEFWSGDCISGEIEAMDEKSIRLRSPLFPTQVIGLGSIRALLHVTDGVQQDAGFLAPSAWEQSIPIINKGGDARWDIRVGSIATTTPGTSIQQQVFVPDVSSTEIDVAWDHSNPHWMLTIGTSPKLELHVRKVETRNELMFTLVIEEGETADIASKSVPSEGVDSTRLRLVSDSRQGRYALLAQGKTICEVKGVGKLRTGGKQPVRLTNVSQGGITLREMRVTRSIFSANPGVESTPSSTDEKIATHVIRLDGSVHRGALLPSTSNEASLLLASEVDGGSKRFELADLERVEFLTEGRKSDGFQGLWPKSNPNAMPSICIVETRDGQRFSTASLIQSGNQLELNGTVLASPLLLDAAEVVSIYFQRPTPSNDSLEVRNNKEIVMRFSSPYVSSEGILEEDKPTQQGVNPSGIRWRPKSLDSGIVLDPRASGFIDLFHPLHKENESASEASDRRERAIVQGKAEAFENAVTRGKIETYGRSLEVGEPSLFLKAGDSIPASMESLKDGMLSVGSPYFGNAKIDSKLVRAIRNLVYTGSDALPAGVLQRLLTLPRSQRRNAPTHLVISREGDALRGNILEMDVDSVLIEVRGEERRLWMKTIAEIIWLDPPPSIEPKDSPESNLETKTDPAKLDVTLSPRGNSPTVDGNHTENTPTKLTCQLMLGLGTRISLIPESIRAGSIEGIHPQLGECKIPISECSRIIFGEEIDIEARSSRFARWKLRNAIDPKFIAEEKAEAEEEDRKAKMIGSPAPDFDLEKLDGSRISLGQLRGKVVVLDFWASWCGPCIKSLPNLVQIVDQFPEGEVEFIAINVDEVMQVVRAASTGLGIVTKVATDKGAKVSAIYGATAIPFTAVIDKKGVLRFTFVGANADTPQKIREAIAECLESESK